MPDPVHPYASRGGLKLAAALDAFKLDVTGFTCADLGCNTGGFTDCLLQHGATTVYAVDTGYGALAWKLRQNPRVVVLERTNALHFDPQQLENFRGCDLVTIDLAWTRQAHAIPAALRWLNPRNPRNLRNQGSPSPGFPPRIITLIKPHYEAEKKLLVKGVLSEADARQVLDDVLAQLPGAGVRVEQWIESPIRGGAGKGKAGNTEYLALLQPI